MKNFLMVKRHIIIDHTTTPFMGVNSILRIISCNLCNIKKLFEDIQIIELNYISSDFTQNTAKERVSCSVSLFVLEIS